MALEHVAHGQTRFMIPGIAPDPRGVILGRYGLLVFPTLEGVVSWLRLYSHEASLDELMAGLAIQRVRTPLASREMLLRIPAISSYTTDRAARLARLVGGAIYTGTAKHFVKYRDDRSPLGYDAVDVGALPAGAALMIHGDDFTQSYVVEGELPLAKLLFRLSLRQVPGARRLSAEQRGELVLAVQRGLGDGVIRYLWRNKIDGEVGLVTPRTRDTAAVTGGDRSYLLMKVRALPERILALLVDTPGIDVFVPQSPNVAVAVGWTHPVELGSCASLLPEDAYHLFWPGDRVDILDGPLALSRLADLTKIELAAEHAGEPTSRAVAMPDPVAVPLRLAPSTGPVRRVAATLVPRHQTASLKRLVYTLPPASLRGLRIAVTSRGTLVVATGELDVIPLGTLLTRHAGVLMPLGLEVVPRVSPDVLAAALGHGPGVVTVLTADGPPFQLADGDLHTLERRAIAKLEAEPAEIRDVAVTAAADPTVVNDPLGGFALWGFPAAEQKLLGSGGGS
ncbi:MAG TPA: hypothetical protein VHE35_27960 [Kofleriaceae bacterium]|nr:hypothetical protein [Kofleriaceae bacterium]